MKKSYTYLKPKSIKDVKKTACACNDIELCSAFKNTSEWNIEKILYTEICRRRRMHDIAYYAAFGSGWCKDILTAEQIKLIREIYFKAYPSDPSPL